MCENIGLPQGACPLPPPGRAGSPARPSHPFRFPGRSTGERTPHRDGEPDEPDRVPSHPRRPGGVIRPAHRDVSSFCVIPLAPVDGPASCRCSFLSFASPRVPSKKKKTRAGREPDDLEKSRRPPSRLGVEFPADHRDVPVFSPFAAPAQRTGWPEDGPV